MGGRLGAWGIQISGVSPIVALEMTTKNTQAATTITASRMPNIGRSPEGKRSRRIHSPKTSLSAMLASTVVLF
jgi:hypothetical protein